MEDHFEEREDPADSPRGAAERAAERAAEAERLQALESRTYKEHKRLDSIRTLQKYQAEREANDGKVLTFQLHAGCPVAFPKNQLPRNLFRHLSAHSRGKNGQGPTPLYRKTVYCPSKKPCKACENWVQKLVEENVSVGLPGAGWAHPRDAVLKVAREVRAAFETLKELFESGAVASFAEAAADGPASAATESMFQKYSDSTFTGGYTPSWAFYKEAAEEGVPLYHVELARSNRSQCVCSKTMRKCPPGSKIDKGLPRVGSLDAESGTYGRWVHLYCWRVPERVWRGVPNPDTCQDRAVFAAAIRSMNEVLLTGFLELDPEHAEALVTHIMDPSNWANGKKRQKAQIAAAEPAGDVKVKDALSASGSTDPNEGALLETPETRLDAMDADPGGCVARYLRTSEYAVHLAAARWAAANPPSSATGGTGTFILILVLAIGLT